MKNINGQGNEITIILPHKKIDCISSHHEQFNQIIHQSHIIITGNNNHVSMHFDSEENVEKLLLNEGFLLIIKENDNTVNLGTIILRYSNILGAIEPCSDDTEELSMKAPMSVSKPADLG